MRPCKTQIQPHYLYNTLDVIRMTAITNDDNVTAEMIDSLSGQLKYLIGNARDMVTLQAEIDSIRNYFKIIRIRYENRLSWRSTLRKIFWAWKSPSSSSSL